MQQTSCSSSAVPGVCPPAAARLGLTGRYPRFRSVEERLAGLSLVHARDDMSRVVSLDFLNRQLLWREFSDLLLFVLPLLSSLKLRFAGANSSLDP